MRFMVHWRCMETLDIEEYTSRLRESVMKKDFVGPRIMVEDDFDILV
jgi:hypothetical protein